MALVKGLATGATELIAGAVMVLLTGGTAVLMT